MMFSTLTTEKRSPPHGWMLEKYSNERRLLNQALFDSRAGIVCSRTARCLQLSALWILVNCYVEIARSSSFAENLTGMEALITMCLSTTDAYGISRELVDGMYRECIRIFSEYEGLHGALTPTLRNTQMLSETLSTTEIDRSLQREILMLTEWANDVGRQSQMLQTKTAFFAKCQEMDPRALVTAFGNVSRYADWKYPDLRGSYDSPEGICVDLGGYPELRVLSRLVATNG